MDIRWPSSSSQVNHSIIDSVSRYIGILSQFGQPKNLGEFPIGLRSPQFGSLSASDKWDMDALKTQHDETRFLHKVLKIPKQGSHDGRHIRCNLAPFNSQNLFMDEGLFRIESYSISLFNNCKYKILTEALIAPDIVLLEKPNYWYKRVSSEFVHRGFIKGNRFRILQFLGW